MDSALTVHRLHFAFTATFHYLFPQLTMGLAPLIVVCKLLAMRRHDEHWNAAARLLARLFSVSFVFGVVTGIPMEFQFGTNWARFSRFAGGVIGQTLAMEGMFAFFLESSFLGLFLFGERRLTPRAHLATAFAVFAGSWLSGYFIVATNAWMQHPVGYAVGPDGSATLTSFWALLTNPWAVAQYLHTMGGAAVTGAFACAGLGAYYLLRNRDREVAGRLVRVGVVVAACATVWQIFPSGDTQGKLIAHHQPATLAAMEGLFRTPSAGAPDGDRRPAQHGDAADRQCPRSPAGAQLPHLPALERGGDGARPNSADRSPRQHRSSLLQLPPDGRARDHPAGAGRRRRCSLSCAGGCWATGPCSGA